MRLRAIILVLCVFGLSAVFALPVGAQGTVPASGLDIWGAPQFQVWPNGYFIWRDDAGVHVRWTSAPGQTHQFRGQARVEGQMTSFSPVYPDRSWRQGNRVLWNTPNAGGGDGFDFTASLGDVVQFSLLIDGRMATQGEIFLGVRAYHPSANPFALMMRPQVGYAPGLPVSPQFDIWGAPQFQTWANGYYVWMDEQGAHLRWTSAQQQTHQFRGEATVQGQVVSFSPAYAHRANAMRQQGNRIYWNVSNSGGGDGFDFITNPGDVVQFSLLIDGRMATQEEIFLGARAYHPSANPFALGMRTQIGGGVPRLPGPPVSGYPQRDLWGAPNFQIWPTGYFIWTDDQGVHVRWTSAQGETHRFYGQAMVQGTITYFQPAYPERTSVGWQPGRRQGNKLLWDASNSGGGDGFDFALKQGDVVQFSLQIDGRMATQDEIYLGVRGLHPQQNPLWLRQ